MGRAKLLVVMAGGGHGFQTRQLIKGLGRQFDYVYLLPSDMSLSAIEGLPGGDVFHVPTMIRFMEGGMVRKMFRLAYAVWRSAIIIFKSRPDAVVAVGTAMAVPVMLCGRIFGKKTVFVESITRINDLSMTARLLARYRLCSRLYVQWPELAEAASNVRYRGVVI